jgi:hypothetical protein
MNYEFTDESPFKGITYYRLKQTDFDGRYSYSDPVAVQSVNNKQSSSLIYPNPANDMVRIEADFLNKEDVSVTLINSLGIQVNQVSLKGNISMNLNISHLPSGLYTVFVIQKNHKAGRRILISR